MDLSNITAESLLEPSTFTELFEEDDEVERAHYLIELYDLAEKYKLKTKFDTLYKAYKKKRAEYDKVQRNGHITNIEHWTAFDSPYDRMFCGSWNATEDGITVETSDRSTVLACYHPILPVERLKNIETGDEQVKIAYKRNSIWREVIVSKDIIASANKITALSKQGIAVTSENAKFLVRYLSDVENFNDEYIEVKASTSKLGWIKEEFMPYDTKVIFDSNSRFKSVFESIHEQGDYKLWINTVRNVRAENRIEVKFMLAASVASVIVGMVGALPFFSNLWGATEGGKTVTLMLATSVWADPTENKYMGDFKTTDVALEAKNDFLNNLPLILDDTSRVNSKIRDNFEGLIYDLCSGKGKTRSNKDIGVNRENRWSNAILTTGERPLASDKLQGGAINRVLDLECKEWAIYSNVQGLLEVIKYNYGFAGKHFVQILKQLGKDKVKKIQQEILEQIYEDSKMQKQSQSLSIVLTADRIITDYIFQDGNYMDIEESKQVLIDKDDLSDNERCYQYVLGEVAINSIKFDSLQSHTETWGVIEKGWAIIHNNIFDTICQKGGYSKKAFLSWAIKKGLVQAQSGNPTKVKKISGNPSRCVFLKLDDGIEVDAEGFMAIGEQEKIPFE